MLCLFILCGWTAVEQGEITDEALKEVAAAEGRVSHVQHVAEVSQWRCSCDVSPSGSRTATHLMQ
jgi:hypothetical protein